MKNIFLITGYLSLAAWLVIMVFPTLGAAQTKTSGFSAITGSTYLQTDVLVATVILLGYAVFALIMGNRPAKK